MLSPWAPITVHRRILESGRGITEADVKFAFRNGWWRPRDIEPVEWIGIGPDTQGRDLEYVAIEDPVGEWLVYHAMRPPTRRMKQELTRGGIQ